MDNIIGKRIKRARVGAGLSLRELAGRVAKSHTAIANYEHGELVPDSDTLADLAAALGVRTEFFLRTTEVTLSKPDFRKHPSLPKKERGRIEAHVLEKAERYVELLKLFPQAPVGSFVMPDGLPKAVESLEQVEDVAEALRQAWELGLNPVPNLVDEMESHGIMVLLIDYDARRKFDGLAARVNDKPVIVLGDNWPGDRQRFTAAHELGHIILAGRLADEIDVEDACNRFAGAFLAPREAVRHMLGESRKALEPRELHVLKHEFGLSMNSWLHRARELEIINTATFEKLRRHFKDHGWRDHEPGEPYPRETPRLFEQLVYRALSEGLFGESKAAELMGKTVVEFHHERVLGDVEDAGRTCQ
jgi:Zn-dependent peptidase ImmA (M78 family)/DNA-binding XRE family transcriptional regulator